MKTKLILLHAWLPATGRSPLWVNPSFVTKVEPCWHRAPGYERKPELVPGRCVIHVISGCHNISQVCEQHTVGGTPSEVAAALDA